MRKLTTLLAMLLLFGVTAIAQTKTVTGRVTNEQGDPAQFASVKVQGSKTGVSADADGRFSIKVNEGATLVISAAGLEEQTVKVGASNTLTVTLKRSAATQIQDVVVTTSLGQVRQSKELGYSTAKIRATELTQAKVVNLQNGLTGKVSGLNIQTVNNGVFADTRITLRGIRSLTGNNQPMLVLDGVPISLGYLNTINPNDIQDVTILKSSSSTAIYGPEGVNGAIVITTRKGIKGKPTITFSQTVQLETVSYMPKFQTQFGSGSSVDQYGYGVYDPIENQCYGPEFDGSLVQIGRDAPDGSKYQVTYSPLKNEKRKFWNTGLTSQTDVSMSTGDFYLSAQNVLIKGIVPKDENHRVSVRMRAEKEYNRIKASFNLAYTRTDYNITTQPDRDHSPYWLLINTPMQIPITRFKNWNAAYTDYTESSAYWSNPNGYFNDYYSNPYFIIDNYRTAGRGDNLLGNVELNYRATNWLKFTYRIGGTVSNDVAKSTRGYWKYSDFAKASGKAIASSGDLNASVADGSAFVSRLTSEFFVTMNKEFNKFRIDALLGHSFRDASSKNLNISSNNLGNSTLYNVAVRKGEPTVSESDSKNRLQRFFGKVGVGYNDWAFAEITGSYDMDSRLGNPYNFKTGDISFFYPGASLSFLLHEAIPGLKDNKYISFLKLRGAISKTGNVNLGSYALENTYAAGTFFPFGNTLGFSANDVLRQSSYKPEFVVNKEIGLEVGFLKNRINLEATVYRQDNSDQLITVAYSAATGYPFSLLNAATFHNDGLELDLKLTPLVKINKVTIDLKLNYTKQSNKVTKIVDGVDELGIGNGNYVAVGRSAYSFKLTDYVRDDKGHVIVDPVTGMPERNPNLTYFGSTVPSDIFGINLNVNWKNFTFAAVGDYRGGNQIYTGGLGTGMDFSGVSLRSASNSRRPFVFPNSVYWDGSKYVENTNIYTRDYGYNFWSQDINTGVNSNYLVSGAFWKLREVSITYNFPDKTFKGKIGNVIKGMSVQVSGRNLLMILPKTNQWYDPEFSNTTGNAQGVANIFNTPPTRIFGANVTVTF
jgi:TonB-linked SusC/RagA family outer membrane protein